jgi:tetratricopeptide (TPR) repeat protein
MDECAVQWQADDLCKRGEALCRAGRAQDAIPLYEQALELRRKLPGTEYEVMLSLARVLIIGGEYVRARQLLAEAIAIVERRFYSEHADMAPLLDALAACAISEHNWSEAEQLVERSLKIKQRCELGTACDVIESMRTLAVVQIQLGKYDKAEELLKKGLTITDESTIGPSEEFHWQLGRLYVETNKPEEAQRHFAKALALFPLRAGKNHRYAFCLQDYAQFLRRKGEDAAAETLESDAKKVLESPVTNALPEQDLAKPLYFADGLYAATILH